MGKIELDHTGSGSGVTLSSDGTDLLLDGTAIGGGGGAALDLYAENPSSPTAPSATGTNAVAIGDSAVAAGTKALSGPVSYASGFNSFAAANANNVGTYGAKGDYAVALGFRANSTLAYSTAIGPQASALGNYATAIGRQAYSVTDSVALAKSYASGTDSLAAAIASNSSSYGATGANSIAMGYRAKATGTHAISLGYNSQSTDFYSLAIGVGSKATAANATCIATFSSTASGSGSTIIGGENQTASAIHATVLGGEFNTASGPYSFAHGFRAVASEYGKEAHATGRFSSDGDAQAGTFVLRSDTTDATSEALTTSNNPASTSSFILPNNSAYAFHGTIVARESATDGTDCAAWKVEGLIRREGSAGTTVLVNSATTVLDNTPSWGLALSADTTNGGLKVEATGAASTNIRWVATIHTSEVTYA